MSPNPLPSALAAPSLEQASHALRQVLLRLDHYAKNQVQRLDPSARYATSTMAHVQDLQALLTAVEQYEQAVVASLPPAPVHVRHLAPAHQSAYRTADPAYQLGYAHGYAQGTQQGQQVRERALTLYAQHTTLPEPSDSSALVRRVRLLLNFWQDPAPLSVARLDSLRQQLAATSHVSPSIA